jgi:hypothetical protein
LLSDGRVRQLVAYLECFCEQRQYIIGARPMTFDELLEEAMKLS